MVSNREKIDYITNTVKNKGYSLNAFKIERVNGHQDVVWNINLQPHLVCEYFRQHDIKIVPIKGRYGLTSLWFDADPFPTKFYELVDDLPELQGVKKIREYDCEGAIDCLLKYYPTMVNAVKDNYPEFTASEIIDFLIDYFNFGDIIVEISENSYLIEEIIKGEA